MLIRIGFEITVTCPAPVPMLLALSIHRDFAGKIIGTDRVRNNVTARSREHVDTYGNRITRVIVPAGSSTFWSDSIVEVSGRPDPVLPEARQVPVQDLPNETLTYLLGSRYCESDLMGDFAWKQFGQTTEGWPRVQAICDFVHNHVEFGYGYGRPDKTAQQVLSEGKGVCRDFAHLAISLCRAMNIPARYVSGYLGDIGVPDAGPDDFCAWFEVFLDGKWRCFDARYNVPRIGRIPMVRGHDAADVAIITSFGTHQLSAFRVWCHEVDADEDEARSTLSQKSIPYQLKPPLLAPQGFASSWEHTC